MLRASPIADRLRAIGHGLSQVHTALARCQSTQSRPVPRFRLVAFRAFRDFYDRTFEPEVAKADAEAHRLPRTTTRPRRYVVSDERPRFGSQPLYNTGMGMCSGDRRAKVQPNESYHRETGRQGAGSQNSCGTIDI